MSERFELVQRVGVHGPFDRLIARRPSAQGLARLALVDQLRGTPSRARIDELGKATRLAAGASHPGLQRIYGAGRAGGTAWVMTEIVAGERLGFLLERGRMADWPAPPPHIAAELVAQAAEAAGALHARGTAHGHLDAAHVVLDYQGRVRVADTVPAALDHGVGDPDARHDVHALGQLFETIVGGGRIARIEMGRFAPIVGQALALDPNDRPPDGRALAAGLRKALGKPVKAGALVSWIRDACPDRIEVWREVRTVVRGTQVPVRTLRKLARLLAPEASAAPDGARAPDYRSPPTANRELLPVRMAPSTAPPGAGPPVPPPGFDEDDGPTTAPPHTVPPVPPPDEPHRTGPMPVVDPPRSSGPLPAVTPSLRGRERAPLRRPKVSGAPSGRRATAELPRPGSRPKATPPGEQAPLVPPRVTAPVPSPGEDDPTRMHQAPQRPAGFRHPGRASDEPTVQSPVVPQDDSYEPTRPQQRTQGTSVSQEPTHALPPPGTPAAERTVDSGEFTDLLFAVRPPEAEPKRRRRPPGPLGLPEDGFEPSIWADPEPLRPPPVQSLDAILGDLSSGRPTGDKHSGIVVEVARVVDGVVAASRVLHRREHFPVGQPVVRHTGQAVTLCVPKGATGRRLHLGASQTVPEGHCEIPLEPGDRVELRWAQASWRIRVDHAARDAGRATGRRKPWGVWLGALGAGAVLHLLFALGVVSLDAVGVQLTVDEPPPKERFASLKEARELPKVKPKPTVKKRRPKPKPKPVKRRKPDKRAPPPAPADPAEATPQLPSSVRSKVRRKMAQTRKRAQDDAEALMAAVNAGGDATPSADDVTLKDVASSIDAVGKAGKTGAALEVPGVSAPLPGGEVNIGRQKAPLATTGGKRIGKAVGKLGRKTTKGVGRIRGKVRNLSSRTKVSSCSLSKGQVRSAVDRNQGRVVGCYEKALLKSAALSGKLTIEWRITPKGKVRGAKVKSSSLGDPAVAECVLRVIRKTRFPAPPDGGECVIAYPFIFSPSQ